MRGGASGYAVGLILLGAVGGGLAYALAGVGLPLREATLRYALLALIPLSVAPTHALLPDPSVPWLQRLNPPPAALLRRALLKWGGVLAAAVLPVLVWAPLAGAPGGGLEAGLMLLGVGLVAFRDALTLGPASQAWQEGRRGGGYRKLVARSPGASLQVPHGALPALLASLKAYALGAAVVFAGLAWGGVVGGGAWVPAALLVAWGGGRLLQLAPRFDAAFYHTSALYTELFRGADLRLGSRPDLGIDAVYWVPLRWRAHTWAGLVQMDRVLPLGRLVALGVLGLLAMVILGAGPLVVAGGLVLALAARNATILRHAQPALSPPAFHLLLAAPADWAAVRFWMNTRWTLPTALALALVALFSPALSWGGVLAWVGVDLAFAALFALAATHAAERRTRRRYA